MYLIKILSSNSFSILLLSIKYPDFFYKLSILLNKLSSWFYLIAHQRL
mgnify:CR=1 FL=1